MSDDKNIGRTWIDVLFSFSRKTRIGLMILVPVIILVVFLLLYGFAEPGETVSLFGIIKIKKYSQTSKPIDSTELDQTTDSSIKKGKVKTRPDENSKENKEKGGPIFPKATLHHTDPPLSKVKVQSHIEIPIKRHGISVLITGNGQTINWDLIHKITSIIETEGGEIISNPALTSSFVSSGKFERAFQGNPEVITGLGTVNTAAYLFLGKQSVNFHYDSNFEDLITANASVRILIISSNKGTIEDAFTITGNGAGYSESDAKTNAIRNIVKNLPTYLIEAIPKKRFNSENKKLF
ncbi:MAG: hypothetical protein KAT34_14310 [Candidatus Aminicenantes bacterium]|nr:hypothetical protein [Candidatus Aminicenantes bacterium]